MSEVSKERILELQKIIKEEYHKEVSYKEAYEIGNNLVGYFSLLWEIDQRNKKKAKKIKQNSE